MVNWAVWPKQKDPGSFCQLQGNVTQPGDTLPKLSLTHWLVKYTCHNADGTHQSSSAWLVGTEDCMW
jgi:hypothetical protein